MPTDEKIESKLDGNTLRVYWALLRAKGDTVGVRQVQRSLKFSSPALAAYHLDKLVFLGLVEKRDGEYVLIKDVKVGVLKQFVKLGAFMLPRYTMYAVMFTTLLIFTVAGLGESSFYGILAFILASLGSVIFWYETIRLWQQKP